MDNAPQIAALDVPTFADAVDVSTQHVYDLLARDVVRSVMLGAARRIPRTELERVSRLLDEGAAARYLSLSVGQFRKLAADRGLEHVRIGRSKRYDPDHLHALLE